MRTLTLIAAVLLASCAAHTARVATATPADVADALLAYERAMSDAASGRPFPAAIGAVFSEGVLMPAPRGELLVGRERVMRALAATADSAARAWWVPVRVGLAADGTQAFTAGFLITTRADGSRVAACGVGVLRPR